MKIDRLAVSAAVLALGLMLSACGGGGGGVGSTPPPPPPPPPPPAPTYLTWTQLEAAPRDITFQTAGVFAVTNMASAPAVVSASTFAFGDGVKVEYIAALGVGGTYRLTAKNGATTDFSPNFGTVIAPGYVRLDGLGNSDKLDLIIPQVAGVPLSYTMIGIWGNAQGAEFHTYQAVGGMETKNGDMPTTGSASYNLSVAGSVLSGGTIYNLYQDATGTFSANFGAGTVALNMNLSGRPTGGSSATTFGTIGGAGTISSSGPGFTGDLSGAGGTGGKYSGAFFGPQAAETGMAWYYFGDTFEARGSNAGKKN